ncbi:hypothetical protein [Leifsonia shinshuensis]|uniref:Uncharacterized protein n=1 Tax=Leifsonia shinshuensis TaxID=150026 RepID=A0A7G6YFG4_9MICO|nr:hypothetical protein [Leifsonia shinshuensis]QNE37229.1 hypothetical protein F1C12_20325 [Leifsonia shinshuensis]
MKVSSNVGAAQEAASGFAQVEVVGRAQQATVGTSNVSSTVDGATVANSILDSISELVSGVKKQAGNVTALATEIEERDSGDAGAWCEAR